MKITDLFNGNISRSTPSPNEEKNKKKGRVNECVEESIKKETLSHSNPEIRLKRKDSLVVVKKTHSDGFIADIVKFLRGSKTELQTGPLKKENSNWDSGIEKIESVYVSQVDPDNIKENCEQLHKDVSAGKRKFFKQAEKKANSQFLANKLKEDVKTPREYPLDHSSIYSSDENIKTYRSKAINKTPVLKFSEKILDIQDMKMVSEIDTSSETLKSENSFVITIESK